MCFLNKANTLSALSTLFDVIQFSLNVSQSGENTR